MNFLGIFFLGFLTGAFFVVGAILLIGWGASLNRVMTEEERQKQETSSFGGA